MTKLGELLRLYRAINKLSIRDLAKDLDISIATLSRIERGHKMETDAYLKILNWLAK